MIARMKQDPVADTRNGSQQIECGEAAAKHFAFDEGYRNLNHGGSTFRQKIFQTEGTIAHEAILGSTLMISQAPSDSIRPQFDLYFAITKSDQTRGRMRSFDMSTHSDSTSLAQRWLSTYTLLWKPVCSCRTPRQESILFSEA